MRFVAAALGAVVLAGCAPAPTPTEPPSAPPRPTVSVPPQPSSAPASAASTTRSPEPALPPQEPPPAPVSPAPSTAGSLGEADVAKAEGWTPTARPGSSEEGYLGNGTWVHAVSAEHSAYAAIALGCAELGAYPQPTAALEGTLAGPEGRPGVGVTLEFAGADEARGYFDEWVRQAKACEGTATELLSLDADTWVGRRNLETLWSETVGVRGERVVLLIVDQADADLSGAIPAP